MPKHMKKSKLSMAHTPVKGTMGKSMKMGPSDLKASMGGHKKVKSRLSKG